MVTGLRAKENKALAAFPTFAMNHDYGCDENKSQEPTPITLRFCISFTFSLFSSSIEF
jgi:hypothetical protein